MDELVNEVFAKIGYDMMCASAFEAVEAIAREWDTVGPVFKQLDGKESGICTPSYPACDDSQQAAFRHRGVD